MLQLSVPHLILYVRLVRKRISPVTLLIGTRSPHRFLLLLSSRTRHRLQIVHYCHKVIAEALL